MFRKFGFKIVFSSNDDYFEKYVVMQSTKFPYMRSQEPTKSVAVNRVQSSATDRLIIKGVLTIFNK